jgi:hypothetical protein
VGHFYERKEHIGSNFQHMLTKFRPLMATAAKARAPPAVTASKAAAAAVELEEHVHYKHTDACHQLRWTAK